MFRNCLCFRLDDTVQLRHLQRMHTSMNTRTQILLLGLLRKSYLYEYLWRLSRQIFEIDEVTTGASLSRMRQLFRGRDVSIQERQAPASTTEDGEGRRHCWRCLSAIFTRHLYSIIKENYMPYSHIYITNLAPQLFLSFVHFRWARAE